MAENRQGDEVAVRFTVGEEQRKVGQDLAAGRRSAQAWHSDRVGSMGPASGDAGFAEAVGPDVFR